MKNKTEVFHVFTTGYDVYFTPAEGGEKAARQAFNRFKKEYGCARIYHRYEGEDEDADGDCIAAAGPLPG